MTDDASESTYRSPPPLWKPSKPQRTPWGLTLSVVAVAVVIVVLSMGGERLLSTSPEPAVVRIVSRDGVLPSDDGPPSFRYGVALENGALAHYWSEHVHNVGDRLTVLASRGRLTGRIVLSEPRREER